MLRIPVNNIVNSKEWGNEEWLSYFQSRLNDMKSKRAEVEEEWDSADTQITGLSYYNNEGELEVNVPLETNLTEIYMGRTNGRVMYDIRPDGQANVEELQPAKFALDFFLDGNTEDNFWKENKDFRSKKATYGTGVRCTQHRCIIDNRYKLKADAEINKESDLLKESNYEAIEHETYLFFPQNIHPRDFYVDDSAYGEQSISKAEDCILKERLSWAEFEARYGQDSIYNTDDISSGNDDTPINDNDLPIQQDYVVVHHYYYRKTKKYLVVANENHIVYNGLYFNEDGKLPFVMVQHYTNTTRIWGDGIPKRVGYLKAYKSEILQDILTGAAMSSGLHLLVGNDDEIGQDWTVGGRQMNLWRTTGGADRVQQVNTSPNLGFFTTVLAIIDELVVQDTGDNLKAPYQAPTDKVGIQEIMEANKIVRQSSVDENYNIGLDEALTQTLSRIQQYAPSLMSKKIYEGKDLIKVVFPMIKMDGYEMIKENGKKVVKEAIGKFGYFELKPGVVQGVGVKVVTSSTSSAMPILERQKITEYMNNLTSLGNIAALDQSGKMLQELSKWIRFDELLGWMSDSYGYDINGLKANTEKDNIKEKNLKLIENLKEALTTNPQENVGPMENKGLGGATSQLGQAGEQVQGNQNPMGAIMNGVGGTTSPL